jgi:hypothetical protein
VRISTNTQFGPNAGNVLEIIGNPNIQYGYTNLNPGQLNYFTNNVIFSGSVSFLGTEEPKNSIILAQDFQII